MSLSKKLKNGLLEVYLKFLNSENAQQSLSDSMQLSKHQILNLADDMYTNSTVIVFNNIAEYTAKPITHLTLMDIFFLSSLSDSTSITHLEAMSQDNPVVATGVGCIPEVVEHKLNDLVSSNGKKSEVSKSILELIQTLAKQNWKDGCVKNFTNLFYANKMLSQFSILYKGVQ
jgi:glycosyltransferase involved in cell wall biosynthesis